MIKEINIMSIMSDESTQLRTSIGYKIPPLIQQQLHPVYSFSKMQPFHEPVVIIQKSICFKFYGYFQYFKSELQM